MRLNPRMWVAALRIIPRVEQGEWRELDLVSRWLIASRGATLIMTFLSATLAALFAALVGGVDVVLYVLLALGLVLAHGSSNLFNDYWDYKQGVDEGNYFRAQYGPHPLLTGLMSERQLLVWAGATGVIALLIAAYLTFLRGPWVLVLTVAGAALMLTYAGKPFPLKRLGLGEPAVFLAWGPLMIGGSYWVLTGSLPAWVLVASLPYALGVTSVLFGKHIDKIEDDEAKGIRTLPVLLGEAPRALRLHRPHPAHVRADPLPRSGGPPGPLDPPRVPRRAEGLDGHPPAAATSSRGTPARVPRRGVAPLVRGGHVPAQPDLRNAVRGGSPPGRAAAKLRDGRDAVPDLRRDPTSLRSVLGRRPGAAAALLSLAIYAVLGYLLLAPRGVPPSPELRLPFSLATAAANALTLVLLAAGWVAVRGGRRARHRRYMELALLSISAFLVLYVTRQYVVGTLAFGGPPLLYRWIYLPLLLPHLAVSAAAVPPVLYNFLVGVTRELHEVGLTLHPRVGRVVVPLWMLSSALGLVIFALLQAFPA